MKKKNFNKKLVLNKKIIVDLNQNQMKSVGGGYSQEYTYCKDLSCEPDCFDTPHERTNY